MNDSSFTIDKIITRNVLFFVKIFVSCWNVSDISRQLFFNKKIWNYLTKIILFNIKYFFSFFPIKQLLN
jgi:hypothetical protein